jgi:hypothetical protein
MNTTKLGVFSIIALLLLSMSISLVAAQYTTQKTTDVIIGSDGTFTATESDIGVTYMIEGASGATGSVTASVYSGNPQASASIPSGISLSHFIVITFDMSASDFTQATITISYSDGDVVNIGQPYTVYKYVADSDNYISLPTTVDAAAKTVTVTLTSIDDPLLAIGGATAQASTADMTTTWIIVTVAAIVIVLLAVFLVIRWRRQ